MNPKNLKTQPIENPLLSNPEKHFFPNVFDMAQFQRIMEMTPEEIEKEKERLKIKK